MAANVIEIVLEASDNASKTIQGFGQALAAAGITAFAKEMAEAAYELGTLGQQAAAAEARFVAFAGSAAKADAILAEIQTTTAGTVDRMTAMEAATRFLSMGLASTADESATLINMAMRLGDQTQSAGDRIENFSLLLANTSVPRLDSFGISAGNVRNRIAELQEQNEGMSRETAFMTAVMEEGAVAMEKLGDAGLDATQNADQATAAFTDLKIAIGAQLAPALAEAQGEAGGFISNLQQTVQAANEMDISLWSLQGNLLVLQDLLSGGKGELGKYRSEQESLARASEASAERMGLLAESLEDVSEEVDDVSRKAGGSAGAFDTYNQALLSSENAAARAAQAQRDLEASMQATSDQAAASLSEMSDAAFAQAQIQALQDAGIEGEAFMEAQREILMHFGLLTEEEIAQQEALDGVIAAYAEGSVEASTLGNRMETIRDVAAEDISAFEELNNQIPLSSERISDLSGVGGDAAGHLATIGINIGTVRDNASDAIAPVDDLATTIDALESKVITITVEQRINTVKGAAEAAAGSGLSQEDLAGSIGGGMGFASGGAFTVPPGFSNDTFPMRVSSGEQVIVIPRDTTNNYNLSVNSGKAASSVEQDFNFMRAFSR